jgi:hypothetical protein
VSKKYFQKDLQKACNYSTKISQTQNQVVAKLDQRANQGSYQKD